MMAIAARRRGMMRPIALRKKQMQMDVRFMYLLANRRAFVMERVLVFVRMQRRFGRALIVWNVF